MRNVCATSTYCKSSYLQRLVSNVLCTMPVKIAERRFDRRRRCSSRAFERVRRYAYYVGGDRRHVIIKGQQVLADPLQLLVPFIVVLRPAERLKRPAVE